MFHYLRRLMAVPFARPPRRRNLWSRFAPEWYVAGMLGAYVIFGLLMGIVSYDAKITRLPEYCGLLPLRGVSDCYYFGFWDRAFHYGLAMTCGLAGLVMVFAPLVAAATTLAAEHQRGTLEAMLLAQADLQRAMLGRFLNIVTPWLRFAIYMLPVYFGILFTSTHFGFSGYDQPGLYLAGPMEVNTYGAAPWSLGWLDLVSRPMVPDAYSHGYPFPLGIWRMEGAPAYGTQVVLMVSMRWLNDVSSMLFGAALAFFISSRAQTVSRAVLVSVSSVAVVLVTVLSPDAWWLLTVLTTGREHLIIASATIGDSYRKAGIFTAHDYQTIAAAIVVVRIVLTAKLVKMATSPHCAQALEQ